MLASAFSRSRTFHKHLPHCSRRARAKIVAAKHRNQHARRVRYPSRCSLMESEFGLDFLAESALTSRAMQNQSNLMSSFEFIAALMSIIIGLGVTNLLAGAGRAFYRRKENPLDEVHIVLTVATLLLLVLDRKSTRLNSSHSKQSRMPSSA